MTIQCENCGRIRVDGGPWTHDGAAMPTVLAECALCKGWRERLALVKQRREGRRLLQDRARGYHLDPDAVDWDEMKRGQ